MDFEYSTEWNSKTLEELENDYWDKSMDSDLLRTCNLLRKKPLGKFEIEDLRIMIDQNIALNYLIPIALEKINEILEDGGYGGIYEGDFYDIDLFKSVLNCDRKFWQYHPKIYKKLKFFILQKKYILVRPEPDLIYKLDDLLNDELLRSIK